jgi:hypothetical protein
VVFVHFIVLLLQFILVSPQFIVLPLHFIVLSLNLFWYPLNLLCCPFIFIVLLLQFIVFPVVQSNQSFLLTKSMSLQLALTNRAVWSLPRMTESGLDFSSKTLLLVKLNSLPL